MYGTVIVLLIYDYKIISLNWLFILTELPDGGNRMANLVFHRKVWIRLQILNLQFNNFSYNY